MRTKGFLGSMLALLCTLGLLAACGAEQVEVEEPAAWTEFCTTVELKTLDDLLDYSTNVVKARLTSMEEFSGGTYVYLFDVTEDFTENTPQQIHVYHSFDPQYTAGTSYYLFLEGTDLVPYPHTVYSPTSHDLGFLDAKGVRTLSGEDISRASPAEDVIAQAVQENPVGAAVEGMLPKISFAEEISEVAKEADVIARVRLSQEGNINKYVSIYEAQLLEIVKGPEESVAPNLILPPELDQGKEYYVFLARDPQLEREYNTFAHYFPVLEVTEANTAALGLP